MLSGLPKKQRLRTLRRAPFSVWQTEQITQSARNKAINNAGAQRIQRLRWTHKVVNAGRVETLCDMSCRSCCPPCCVRVKQHATGSQQAPASCLPGLVWWLVQQAKAAGKRLGSRSAQTENSLQWRLSAWHLVHLYRATLPVGGEGLRRPLPRRKP